MKVVFVFFLFVRLIRLKILINCLIFVLFFFISYCKIM
jgi:hypothetical protein